MDAKTPGSDVHLRNDPAIGYSVTANLGGDRQLVMQCFVGQDEEDASIFAKIDRVMMVIDRAKAPYDIREEMKKFTTVAETLGNLIDGIPHAERNYQTELEGVKVQIETLTNVADDLYKEGYTAHTKSGKRGSYEPSGHAKVRIDRAKMEIAALEKQLESKPADRRQHLEQLINSILHYQQALAGHRAAIDEGRKLLGQEPLEAYKDLEAYDASKLLGDSAP